MIVGLSNTELKGSLTVCTRGCLCHQEQCKSNRNFRCNWDAHVVSTHLPSREAVLVLLDFVGVSGLYKKHPLVHMPKSLPRIQLSMPHAERLDLSDQMLELCACKCSLQNCFTTFPLAYCRRGRKE
jgi:hypothetical protein